MERTQGCASLRYLDVHDEDIPACYQHQLEAATKYREQVAEFEKLVNEKWAIKPDVMPSVPDKRAVKKSVTITKAQFIRANPSLDAQDLVNKASKGHW